MNYSPITGLRQVTWILLLGVSYLSGSIIILFRVKNEPDSFKQEFKQMRFEEAYEGYQAKRITQDEATGLLGVCSRSCRRYMNRYEETGLEGLYDSECESLSVRLI
jgi:hypothetical protein